MATGFQRVLDHIRAVSDTEAEKGRLFERLMRAYFLNDAAKIVGCWRTLQSPEGEEASDAPNVLRRAIAFTNTIRSSQRLQKHWQGIVDQAAELLPEGERGTALRCETQHMDGQNHALERKAKIEWLKGSADG